MSGFAGQVVTAMETTSSEAPYNLTENNDKIIMHSSSDERKLIKAIHIQF